MHFRKASGKGEGSEPLTHILPTHLYHSLWETNSQRSCDEKLCNLRGLDQGNIPVRYSSKFSSSSSSSGLWSLSDIEALSPERKCSCKPRQCCKIETALEEKGGGSSHMPKLFANELLDSDKTFTMDPL